MAVLTEARECVNCHGHIPCYACGRFVSARRPERGKRGKAKKHHKCPHGRRCVAGSPAGGQGYNRAPRMGPYSCVDCASIPDAQRAKACPDCNGTGRLGVEGAMAALTFEALVRRLFARLRAGGFVAGVLPCCNSCSLVEAQRRLDRRRADGTPTFGIAYSHGQDRASWKNGRAWVGFDTSDRTLVTAERVGAIVADVARKLELGVAWDGTADRKVLVYDPTRFEPSGDALDPYGLRSRNRTTTGVER